MARSTGRASTPVSIVDIRTEEVRQFDYRGVKHLNATDLIYHYIETVLPEDGIVFDIHFGKMRKSFIHLRGAWIEIRPESFTPLNGNQKSDTALEKVRSI